MPAMKGLKVIDTCGAGDIFGGSAMFRFLQHQKAADELTKEDLDDITHFASVSGGLSTQKHGGISSIPALGEVLAAL